MQQWALVVISSFIHPKPDRNIVMFSSHHKKWVLLGLRSLLLDLLAIKSFTEAL